jgi:hypothetical protein
MAIVFMIGLYRWNVTLAPDGAALLTGLTMVNATFWNYYRRTLTELAFVMVMIWTAKILHWTRAPLASAVCLLLLVASWPFTW